jgi:phosphotriesterase-related protein
MPEGPVVTVSGEVRPSELGPTLCHEHCFIDLSEFFAGEETPEASQPVEMPLLSKLRVRPFSTTRDNLVLSDFNIAAAELSAFTGAGGKSIVEVTPIGVGRDPERLRRLAAATGATIVMGTALYVEAMHPAWVRQASVDDLATLFEREVRDGVDDTGIRAGVIGEIGVSGVPRGEDQKFVPVTAEEEKVLQAAARAALATGATVSLHLDPREPRSALPAIDLLEQEGLQPDRIVAGHMDIVHDADYHLAVAGRGVFVAYDQLGCECYSDELGPNFSWGHDSWRLPFVKTLVEAGHADQLLLSQDVAMKMDLRTYGGRGYAHVLTWVVPTLERLGVSRSHLDAMLVQNPARAFSLA